MDDVKVQPKVWGDRWQALHKITPVGLWPRKMKGGKLFFYFYGYTVDHTKKAMIDCSIRQRNAMYLSRQDKLPSSFWHRKIEIFFLENSIGIILLVWILDGTRVLLSPHNILIGLYSICWVNIPGCGDFYPLPSPPLPFQERLAYSHVSRSQRCCTLNSNPLNIKSVLSSVYLKYRPQNNKSEKPDGG